MVKDEGPIVRPATVSDALQIATVHVESWTVAYRGMIADVYLDALRPADRLAMWRQHLETPAPTQRVFVVELDGRVVGVSTSLGSGPGDRIAELQTLYLHPAVWRRGLGEHLLRVMVDDLISRRYQEAVLWVLPENTRARRFYEAQGWTDDKLVRDDVVHGVAVDEMRYRLRLTDRGSTGI